MAGKITVRVFSVFKKKKKETRVSQFLVSCDNYQRVALCFRIKSALNIVSFFHSFWKSRCFGYPFFLCHPQLWCFSVLFPGDSHWLTLAGSLLLCSHNVYHKGPRRLRALCVIQHLQVQFTHRVPAASSVASADEPDEFAIDSCKVKTINLSPLTAMSDVVMLCPMFATG